MDAAPTTNPTHFSVGAVKPALKGGALCLRGAAAGWRDRSPDRWGRNDLEEGY